MGGHRQHTAPICSIAALWRVLTGTQVIVTPDKLRSITRNNGTPRWRRLKLYDASTATAVRDAARRRGKSRRCRWWERKRGRRAGFGDKIRRQRSGGPNLESASTEARWRHSIRFTDGRSGVGQDRSGILHWGRGAAAGPGVESAPRLCRTGWNATRTRVADDLKVSRAEMIERLDPNLGKESTTGQGPGRSQIESRARRRDGRRGPKRATLASARWIVQAAAD